MSKEMANILSYLRESTGFTQEQIAKQLKVDRSTYSNYERGITEPSIKTILKLADIFNVSTDMLLGRGEEVARVADPKGMPIYTLTKDEREVVIGYRSMDKDKRSKTKDIMNEMLVEEEKK